MRYRELRNARRWLANPYAVLDEGLREQGLTFPLDLPVLGRSIATGDRAVLDAAVDHDALDGGQGIRFLRQILGDGSLITLDGAAHAERRSVIARPFQAEAARTYDRIHAEATLAELAPLSVGAELSAHALLRRIGLRAIVRVIFGELDGDGDERVRALVEDFLGAFHSPLFLFVGPLHARLGRFGPWGRALERRRRLRSFIGEHARACRRGETSGTGVLDRLVAGGEIADDDELATEVLTLLMFGHDTAAATLAWACAHLYARPGLLERARAEARERTPVDPDRLPFLTACLKESMRMSPVVVHLTRVATRRTLVGPLPLAPGQRLLPCSYLAHRDPRVFPEPDAFRPERFLGGRSYRHSYFPFGFGSRTCIGRPFAMRQMQVVLGTILNRVDLALAPGYVPAPARNMVLVVPRDGTRLVRRAAPCA